MNDQEWEEKIERIMSMQRRKWSLGIYRDGYLENYKIRKLRVSKRFGVKVYMHCKHYNVGWCDADYAGLTCGFVDGHDRCWLHSPHIKWRPRK